MDSRMRDWIVSISMPCGQGTRTWALKTGTARAALNKATARDNRFGADFENTGMVLIGVRLAKEGEIPHPLSGQEVRLLVDTTR